MNIRLEIINRNLKYLEDKGLTDTQYKRWTQLTKITPASYTTDDFNSLQNIVSEVERDNPYVPKRNRETKRRPSDTEE